MSLCEAAALDAAEFKGWADAVPPCDEIGDVVVGAYTLCAGCAEALEALTVLGDAAVRRREERGT